VLKGICCPSYFYGAQMENSKLNELREEMTLMFSHARKHAPFNNTKNYIVFLETLVLFMHKDQIDSKKNEQERKEEHQRLLIEIKDLTEIIAKFHQGSDATRRSLFKSTIHRYFKVRQNIIAKRGYTFGAALEDENKTNQHYSPKEFGIIYTDLVNHFKTWRSRNKEFVLEVEKSYTAVT